MWRKASGELSDALVHITKPAHHVLVLVKKQPSSNCLDSLVYQLKLVELDMMLTRCCKASASCQGPPAHVAAFAKAPPADYGC